MFRFRSGPCELRRWVVLAGVSGPLAALLTFLAGCGAEGVGAGWAGTVETLPSGAVRVVNPAEGLWEGGEAWRLVQDMTLGAAEGDGAQVFGGISGLEVDADGRIYVLDRQANELRIFSPGGTHLRSVGRSGGGPGEYATANGLVWLDPDTLIVVDQRGERYSILSREGDFVRSVPRRLGFFGWVFSGGYHAGRIYELSSVNVGGERKPALLGTWLQGPEVPSMEDPSAVGGPGDLPLSSTIDTLVLPRYDIASPEAFSVQSDRGGAVMGVPFAASSVYSLAADGSIWHGHGSEFRIFHSTPRGDPMAEIVLRGEPAPVTDEEIEEWEAGAGPARFRAMGGELDLTRIPRAKPFFSHINVDPDGYLWLTVPAGPSQAVFAVVDPDGRYLGRVKLEGVNLDPFIPPVVRGGRLYLVERDELDVPRVSRFRIER